MVRDFTANDEGKSVMTADGDPVGIIDRVTDTDAFVKPDAGLSQSTRNKLGWTQKGEETYQLRKSKVQSIDEDAIHLRSSL